MPESSPIKAFIIDDSAVIRSVITRTLNNQDDIKVVGSAINGQEGVDKIKKFDPDVVILDIEMPVMDGITALPLILKEKPGVKVLICSTLSARGADISIRALTLGATECILKPGGASIVSAKDFQEDLVRTIRNVSRKTRLSHKEKTTSSTPASKNYTLHHKRPILRPKILAIGSSTGGPKALIDILKDIKNPSLPIVITQHMPKTFTALLAKHITSNCDLPCSEGQEGEAIRPGQVYVAPGGYHMTFVKDGDDTKISLNEGPLENFCRPSVDPMLRSLINIYNNRILFTMLTGMGHDGLHSCKELVQKGGEVIAQDEETSIVWGMPGAVAMEGICTEVLPQDKIANAITKRMME